jgi:site-specific recombinase XerD
MADATGIGRASTDGRNLMLDDESEYDKRCQQIRQENAALLGEFSHWLKKAGIGAATIRSHCTNLDFYLNHFLLYADLLTPADGVSCVGEFLGDWFIHKAMWSNKTTVKANATSLKKFYGFLAERGLIKPEEFASLKQQIKDELPDWLDAVERYNNPDADLLEDGWPI